MKKFKSKFCDCKMSPRPPHIVRDGKRYCGLCSKPRLVLPSDPVAILLTQKDIDPKTGKITQEHIEHCSGCALCEAEG